MPSKSGSVGTTEYLAGIEERIEEQAGALAATAPSAAVGALAEALWANARQHRSALERARDRIDSITPSPGELSVIHALLALYSSLNEAVLAYSAVHALAHRAFDSSGDGNTADLAESHLRAYATLIQQLDVTVPDAVVLEASERGHACRCKCPACDLGLCLCSPHGANTMRQAWRETLPPPVEGGLAVRPPRPGSEAQKAGLRTGDRVVSIDGTTVANDLDTSAVQSAIRAHAAGDPLQLTLTKDGGRSRTVTVQRP